MLKLAETWCFNGEWKPCGWAVTLSSTFLLVLSCKNPGPHSIFHTQRRHYTAAEAKSAVGHSLCHCFSICDVSMTRRRNQLNEDPGGLISETRWFVTLHVGFTWPLLVGELFSGVFTETPHFQLKGRSTCQVEAFFPRSCDQSIQSKQLSFPVLDNETRCS